MPSTYHIAINLGNGRFARAYTVEGLGAFRLAGAVDVDLDGDRDLVAGRTVWFNRGTFAIDPQPDVSGTLPTEPYDLYDFDHDGDPDVLANTGFVLRNDGTGNLSREPEQIPWGPAGAWYAREGYRGDFDGDGDEDRIVEQADLNGLIGMRLMLNTGGGGFVDGGLAVANGVRFVQTTSSSHRTDLWHVTGDVDGDGDLDIVQGAPTGVAGVTVWWNDGFGHFTQGPISGVAHAPRFLIDLDVDGFLDLVTTLRIGWGDGQGNFLPGPSFSGWAEPNHDLLDVGDLNADNLPDIAFFERGVGDRVLVYLNQGNRTFVERSVQNVYASALWPRGVEIHDFDRDGHQDLLVWPGYWVDGRRNAVFLFGDGSGWFPRRSLQMLDVRAKPADLDGDGDLDVVGASVSRGVPARPFVDGYRLQYGVSTATAAGFAPTLGASGPFLAGAGIEVSLTGAPGAAFVALGVGGAPATLPGFPLPGLVGHVSPVDVVIGLVAAGVPGEEGTGRLRIPVSVPASMAGKAVFLQAWVLDSATLTQLLQTNGLGLVFG
jgi:hypothetical protein